MLPTDSWWWFGTETDHAGQIDGTSHADKYFVTLPKNGRAWL